VDPLVVDALVASRLAQTQSPLDALTERERGVLALMAQGKNNEGIAATLFMSLRVVEKQINSIFSKLQLGEEPDVHRRVKAVLQYLAEGMS
jgi:DNA-binding NarL/FixJ family response regulator